MTCFRKYDIRFHQKKQIRLYVSKFYLRTTFASIILESLFTKNVIFSPEMPIHKSNFSYSPEALYKPNQKPEHFQAFLNLKQDAKMSLQRETTWYFQCWDSLSGVRMIICNNRGTSAIICSKAWCVYGISPVWSICSIDDKNVTSAYSNPSTLLSSSNVKCPGP